MMAGVANSTWSTIRNGCDCSVRADGWHFEQMPSGNGACVPLGHGVMTESDNGSSGGRLLDEIADGGRPARSLRRYAWKERCLIWFSAWYLASYGWGLAAQAHEKPTSRGMQ